MIAEFNIVKSDKNLEKEVCQLFDVINSTNRMIEMSKGEETDLDIRQFKHLRNQFFKELEDLLRSRTNLLRIKQSKIIKLTPLASNDLEKQMLHQFEIIERTDQIIESSKKINDDLGIRQYTYLKHEFLTELEEMVKVIKIAPLQLNKVAKTTAV